MKNKEAIQTISKETEGQEVEQQNHMTKKNGIVKVERRRSTKQKRKE